MLCRWTLLACFFLFSRVSILFVRLNYDFWLDVRSVAFFAIKFLPMMDRQIECHLFILLFVSEQKNEMIRFSCQILTLLNRFLLFLWFHFEIKSFSTRVFYAICKRSFCSNGCVFGVFCWNLVFLRVNAMNPSCFVI